MAMDKYDIEKDIATDIKKHFDEECEGSWHCVVGQDVEREAFTAHDKLCLRKSADEILCVFAHDINHFILFPHAGRHRLDVPDMICFFTTALHHSIIITY